MTILAAAIILYWLESSVFFDILEQNQLANNMPDHVNQGYRLRRVMITQQTQDVELMLV